ncbi:MAG: recombinase family protein, partial [Actinomycetota bacterium]|nr:recombinase family protein [Actinomycetota bacterium]
MLNARADRDRRNSSSSCRRASLDPSLPLAGQHAGTRRASRLSRTTLAHVQAVIYARQSLDRDGSGAAVERQVADCRSLAEARGWDVAEVLIDNDLSASSGKRRPEYERLLDRVRSGGVRVVVVWHLDRLTRRLADLVTVLELCRTTGTKVATVTGDLDLSTDTGRMLAGILVSVAQAEVERKGTRQRRANAQRAEAGSMGWTRRPFGYDRHDGKVVLVPAEAEALQQAAADVLAGATVAAAARKLDAAGLTTTAGKPWNVTSLRRALLNPRYAGRVTYNGADVAEGHWPVILDADTQERLAEVLRDVRRRVQQGTEPRYLLSGLARCGRCDEVMFASPLKSKGRTWHVYRCRGCYLARRSDLVDGIVEGAVLGRLARPDAASLLVPDVD